MSAAKSQSKKRKHESISKDDGVSFQLASTPGSVGPVLVSYPALEPPPSTQFRCYVPKKRKATDNTQATEKPYEIDDMLVVGETNSVEFSSSTEESKRAAQSGCRYLVAVYDRSTGSVKVLPIAKSPYILTRTVKNLKSILPAPAPSALEYKEAKNVLGETFGTKKAKAAIRAEERSHIDVSAMEGVMDFVMDGIEKASGGLMTKEEAKESADQNRLIPPYSATATEPEDIYPLHDIIPEPEWKLLPFSAFEKASDDKDRIALLPFRNSSWINDHIERLGKESGKGKKKIFKMLFYISAMITFHKVSIAKRIDKDKLAAKMTTVPELIVDSLLSRFSEVARGSNDHQMTTKTKTTLLTHIFALCLKVDKYATDTSVIAHDLSMSITSVNQLFKSLGCKMSALSTQELSRLGLPQSAPKSKRAILSAPVEFPKPRAGKRR